MPAILLRFTSMRVVLTLNFAGRTEAAIEFYRHAVGAETLFLMRFRDSPDRSMMRPGMEDKVFHATFRIGDTEIMASDVSPQSASDQASFAGFSLAIQAASIDRAQQMFDALSNGGTVQIPLGPVAFTARYGIVIDRFGLSWKITVA